MTEENDMPDEIDNLIAETDLDEEPGRELVELDVQDYAVDFDLSKFGEIDRDGDRITLDGKTVDEWSKIGESLFGEPQFPSDQLRVSIDDMSDEQTETEGPSVLSELLTSFGETSGEDDTASTFELTVQVQPLGLDLDTARGDLVAKFRVIPTNWDGHEELSVPVRKILHLGKVKKSGSTEGESA